MPHHNTKKNNNNIAYNIITAIVNCINIHLNRLTFCYNAVLSEFGAQCQ